MTISKALATYVQSLGVATLGQDLIVGRAPSSNETSDDLWWIVQSGGPIRKNPTGESIKEYEISIFRRGRNYRNVDEELQDLEENINCDGCFQLSGYDTIDLESTSLSIFEDLDAEDRMIGRLTIKVTIYKEC